VDHTWGGAYKFAKRAQAAGKPVVNLSGKKI